MNLLTEAERAAYQRGVADTLGLAAIARDADHPPLMPAPGEPFSLDDLAKRLDGVDPARLAILHPFSAKEALSVKAAARIAGFAPRTVFQWTERFRIGRPVVASMRVSHPALLALLEGDARGLAAILSGRRTDPATLPYLRRAGLLNQDRAHAA